MMQSSGKSPSPSRFPTVGMDVFSCKDLREDQVSCVVDVLRPQQKEHLDM